MANGPRAPGTGPGGIRRSKRKIGHDGPSREGGTPFPCYAVPGPASLMAEDWRGREVGGGGLSRGQR